MSEKIVKLCKKAERNLNDIEVIYQDINGSFRVNDIFFDLKDDEDAEAFGNLCEKWRKNKQELREKAQAEAISKMSDRELLEAIYRKLV